MGDFNDMWDVEDDMWSVTDFPRPTKDVISEQMKLARTKCLKRDADEEELQTTKEDFQMDPNHHRTVTSEIRKITGRAYSCNIQSPPYLNNDDRLDLSFLDFGKTNGTKTQSIHIKNNEIGKISNYNKYSLDTVKLNPNINDKSDFPALK